MNPANNRRPTENAATIVERLAERLVDRGSKREAFELIDLAGAITGLSGAAIFADSTRKRCQVVDAFTDAQAACLAALGRLVAQIDADLDAEDKEDAANLRADRHATGDVTEVRQ